MGLTLKLLPIASVVSALALDGPVSAMQLGAHADGTGRAYNVRGKIYEPSSFANGTYSRAYWIYATFPDGTFMQAGVLDATYQYTDLCQTGFSTFVTALDSQGNSPYDDLYNNGHCNRTGAHFFKLGIVDSRPPHYNTWQWYMDGDTFGPTLNLPWSQDTFTRNNAGAVTEIVKVGSVPPDLPLATVRYNPAIQFITPSSSGQWVDADTGIFLATSDRTCHYALRVDNDNDFSTGVDTVLNPLHCHSPGDSLW